MQRMHAGVLREIAEEEREAAALASGNSSNTTEVAAAVSTSAGAVPATVAGDAQRSVAVGGASMAAAAAAPQKQGQPLGQLQRGSMASAAAGMPTMPRGGSAAGGGMECEGDICRLAVKRTVLR
jgi:hypothetical protein